MGYNAGMQMGSGFSAQQRGMYSTYGAADATATAHGQAQAQQQHAVGGQMAPQGSTSTSATAALQQHAALQQQQHSSTLQLAVPDNLIPCLLGVKGAALNEMMAYSGAVIKISQRNELIPGTNNRIVTITGSPQSMQAAQYLIQQKIQQQANATRS